MEDGKKKEKYNEKNRQKLNEMKKEKKSVNILKLVRIFFLN